MFFRLVRFVKSPTTQAILAGQFPPPVRISRNFQTHVLVLSNSSTWSFVWQARRVRAYVERQKGLQSLLIDKTGYAQMGCCTRHDLFGAARDLDRNLALG